MSIVFRRTAAAIMAVAAPVAGPAFAASIAIQNPSFETLPPGGLPNVGGDYAFSIGEIPGWTMNPGEFVGQFQPGSFFFNYLPDGPTSAYSNGGPISQVVVETAIAGERYTLLLDVGFRNDLPNNGTIELRVGDNVVFATGKAAQLSGDWTTWSASYVATKDDEGAAIQIVLNANSAQGNWDNVRLFAGAIPEPASWAMMIGGFGLIGASARRRKTTIALA